LAYYHKTQLGGRLKRFSDPVLAATTLGTVCSLPIHTTSVVRVVAVSWNLRPPVKIRQPDHLWIFLSARTAATFIRLSA